MRVLLLSANTGEGHNSTGKAIMEALNLRGVECRMVDSLAYVSSGFSRFICGWHIRIYRHCGKLFDKSYRQCEKMADPEEYSPVYDLLGLGIRRLYKTIADGKYDAVICVHPFAGMMLTNLRRRWQLDIPTYLAATDYTCSPTVEQCDLDFYFIPAKEQAPAFQRAGHSRLQLLPLGIPVRQAFYHKEPKAEVRHRLNLPEDGVLALLMCGSMGCGPIEKVARELEAQLPENTTVIAVCGSNQQLYESMQPLAGPRLRVLGYTRNISEYMDAMDFIITKPGGLSSTEAANKALPIIFLNVVGGCETRNFEYFLSQGFAVGSDSPQEVVKLAKKMAESSEMRVQMSEKLKSHFCTNSALDIVDRVIRDVRRFSQKAKQGTPFCITD